TSRSDARRIAGAVAVNTCLPVPLREPKASPQVSRASSALTYRRVKESVELASDRECHDRAAFRVAQDARSESFQERMRGWLTVVRATSDWNPRSTRSPVARY